jgi:hypothetical protein
MRAQLSLALVTLFLAACAADDTPAAMGGTGDSESSTGTPGMTTNPMTTAPSTDGMTMGGTADDTGTTMADPSTGPDPDDSSTGTPPADSSSSDGGVADSSSSSDGGVAESSSSSDGGVAESSSSSDGGVAESSSSSDGGVAESSSSSDGGVAESSSSSDGGVAESSSSSGGEACVEIACGSAVYECGDCQDNDGDGAIDGFDVECVSPCDDDESSFATGIPGDNIDLCHQDCFFDGNSGGGDDGCDWWLACDPLDPDNGQCSIPGGQTCPAAQPQECVDNCQVPNGCDCFGCCTVNVDGVDYDILIGSPDCSLDNFAACPQCTQVESCTDPCDPTDCELCFGETELPPGCKEPTCPDGQTSCESNADCTADYFCQTGCCELIPV